jgi:hypothetical protein
MDRLMRPSFEVVCRVEVSASTPEQAAASVRDMLLDPEAVVHFNVHQIEYAAEPDEFFPNREHGWYAGFNTHGSRSASPVRPSEYFGWEQLRC